MKGLDNSRALTVQVRWSKLHRQSCTIHRSQLTLRIR